MKKIDYREISGNSLGYWGLFLLFGAIIAIAAGSAYYMETSGHWVTGMNNQIVWGLPHVFAIFLIVAASGALNVASIGTVFGKQGYQALGRMSGLLAIALLLGGLLVLVLDLGRPDRLIVAMTVYNFKSIFAWNIFLYTGFMVITAVYLWFMMERKMNRFYKKAGLVAFVWRLMLTTGTGSIFGFLVAREAFDSAVMAPMFVIMSFSFGLAIFLLVLMATYTWTGRNLGDTVIFRLKNLLGVFCAAVLYFTLVFHITALYATEHHGFEYFLLIGGGIFTQLFWIGHVLIGNVLPIALLYWSKTGNSRFWISIAALMVVLGGFLQIYVILIGGQAYPLDIFPGKEVVSGGFFEGQVSDYTPSLWEFLLGIGGVSVAMIMVMIAIKFLRFVPTSLADEGEAA